MTESIKFGPEWLRNSVAAPSQQQQQQQQSHHQQQPQSPSSDSIISRPVLSDHRYGREEMLSLCDKSARLPDALPRFRRLFVADWQTPLALQPINDDEQIGMRGSGGTGTPPWGTHIRPLMPAMGRGTGIIRGGAIERGRGRGRGLYHGTTYARSTSLYDEEGRRWMDRNGTEGTQEWSAGSAVSPRKEGFSRSTLESWRKGTRDENEEGWRSNSNGTATTQGQTAREKWTRSTSWRDGTDNGEPDRANGSSQPNSASPTGGVVSGGGGGGPMINSTTPQKAPIGYKKSWDEESNLPEWATESFDYGGTFDSSGAFHDGERGVNQDDDLKNKKKKELQSVPTEPEEIIEDDEPSPPSPPTKFNMNFLIEETPPPPPLDEKKLPTESNGTSAPQPKITNPPPHPHPPPQHQPPIAVHHMEKMVENFVAHLIMDDDAGSATNSKAPVAPLIEWFYRDPQGDTQGPFSSNDMSEWYKAGYFQENLMVRRSIDNTFTPLGHLVKIFGAARPFITATLDGGPPIPSLQAPQAPPPEVIDPFRMRMLQQNQALPQTQQPPQQQQPPPDVNNWNMMTTEQRMFFMQLAHRGPPPQPTVDPFVMKTAPPPQQPPQQPSAPPLDLRRMMAGSDYFQTTAPPPIVPPQQQQQQPPPPSQSEPDPIQQLIMQLQLQQKTGGVDAAQQWIKSSQQQQAQQSQQMLPGSGNGLDLSGLSAIQNQSNVSSQGVNSSSGSVGVNNPIVQSTSATHWNATPLPIWEMSSSNSNSVQKEQSQSLQHQQPSLQDIQQVLQHQHHQHHLQQQQQQHHHHDPDILQNGIMDDMHHQHQQMQKVESKKKKKEVTKEQPQLQQVSQQQLKEQQQKKQQKEIEKLKKPSEKPKKEERTTQPAAPAPWVGHQTNLPGTSLMKIQKTEAQRRQVEMAAQKERAEAQKMEMMTKIEVRDVKWNLQGPPAVRVKTLDEIQAEEQNAAEREAAIAKREKKEISTAIVADIWNTGAHSMAWQQPKAWSSAGGQSNAGFWEEPVKQVVIQQKQPQMLSKSQTMATISTAKKQPQQQQQQQVLVQPQKKVTSDKKKERIEKKKDDNNNEFTMWCTRSLSAMNGNVDVPTFVSFLQDIESPFEVKDYIKMYLGETKECTEFAKQFLERRSKQRMQQRQQNAHIDDMCSPAPAINPQANNNDFQEVKGKNKKVKSKKVMKAVDNRILGFTATCAPDRINVGDRDYGDA